MQSTATDREILLIARSDKCKAFELAFSTFWGAIYKQAYRKVQSEAIAKDLTQEVFITLWDNLDKLTDYDKLLPYLYAVLRNKTLKFFEKDVVRLRYANSLCLTEEMGEPSSHQMLLGKELLTVISAEVEKMPPRMKEIYILQKNSYCSIRDIAEKLCLSEQTVKNQLQSATSRLKTRIKNYNTFFFLLTLTLGRMLSNI